MAAAEAYRNAPTPNVIMIESDSRSEELLAGLDQLAEVCDAGTKVVVIGAAVAKAAVLTSAVTGA